MRQSCNRLSLRSRLCGGVALSALVLAGWAFDAGRVQAADGVEARSSRVELARKRLRHPHAAGEMLVRIRESAAKADALETLERHGALVERALTGDPRTWRVRAAADRLAETLAALEADPAVEYAEPNYLTFVDRTPNDPSFNSLWGLNNSNGVDVDGPQAWDVTIGSDEVVVGVVDTGIDVKHPDLEDNIWVNPGEIPKNNVDDDGNGYVDDVNGWDGKRNAGEIRDTNGHGTHVSGTIGARGDNGTGVAGVNWRVKLMGLNAIGDGGTIADAIEVIDYAVKMRGRGINVRVLNNSWGFGGTSTSVGLAVKRANAAGILFVAAAGNDSVDNDSEPHFPSSYDVPNVIAVGAHTIDDQISSFSNFGRTSVDIFAPGTGILSTTPNGRYDTFNGTSMASPHVAGVAALVIAAHPTISVPALKARILGSAIPASYARDRSLTGGRVNAARALRQDATPPAVPLLRVQGSSLATLRLDWSAVGDDGAAGVATYYDIRYASSPITEATFNQAAQISDTRVPLEPGGAESAIIKSCASGGSVYVAMRVYDKAGNYSQSATVEAVPGDAPPEFALLPSASSELPLGNPLNLKADDKAVAIDLPFDFPFYGAGVRRAFVSTNGVITFDQPAISPPGGQADLAAVAAIAPLWFDLRTDGKMQSGEDVYVDSTPERVVIRWVAEQYFEPGQPIPREAQPVNFAVALNADGRIDFHYGPGGNQNLYNSTAFPVIGVSDGGCATKPIEGFNQYDSLQSAPAFSLVPFTPGANRPPVLQLPTVSSVTEGTTLTAIFSAVDPEGGPVTLTAALPRNASFDAGTGTLTFTPDSAQAGIAQVVISAIDAQGRVASKTIAVRVVNDPSLPEIQSLAFKKKVTIYGAGFQSGVRIEIDGTEITDAKPNKKTPAEKLVSAAAASALTGDRLHTIVIVNPGGVRSGPYYIRR